jgi:hypothetical protein
MVENNALRMGVSSDEWVDVTGPAGRKDGKADGWV